MKQYGLSEMRLVVEADGWITIHGINLPTRIHECMTYAYPEGRSQTTIDTIAQLSDFRLGPHGSDREDLAVTTAIPEDADVVFLGEFQKDAKKQPLGATDRQLLVVLAPLHNEFFPLAPTITGLRAKLALVAGATRQLNRLVATKPSPWFLGPAVPAIRRSLARRKAVIERELRRLDDLARMKGRPLPDGVLESLDGQRVRLSELIDGKAALLAFWGYTCGPCRKEALLLNELYRRHRDRGFVVVAINCFGESPEMVKRYIKETGLAVPVFRDIGKLSEKYHFAGVPACYWIDRHGNIVDYDFGFEPGTKQHMKAKVKAILDSR